MKDCEDGIQAPLNPSLNDLPTGYEGIESNGDVKNCNNCNHATYENRGNDNDSESFNQNSQAPAKFPPNNQSTTYENQEGNNAIKKM